MSESEFKVFRFLKYHAQFTQNIIVSELTDNLKHVTSQKETKSRIFQYIICNLISNQVSDGTLDDRDSNIEIS